MLVNIVLPMFIGLVVGNIAPEIIQDTKWGRRQSFGVVMLITLTITLLLMIPYNFIVGNF